MAPLTIGLLIDWLDNDYASSLSFAFFDEARARGMRFLCFVGHGLGEAGTTPNASNLAYQLANERVLSALVVASLGIQSTLEDQRRYLERYRALPLCTLTMSCPGVPHVAVDNAAGMREAVLHLIRAHGRRRIAFVRGPESNEDAEQRYRGYLEALEQSSVPFDPELVAPGTFTREAGRSAIRLLVDTRRARFDAVVAANDTMAATALLELQARGLRVPEDVALCGFDDVEDSRFADPPISSVRQPWRARAQLAVEALLAQREGRPTSNQVVAAEFVSRRSCGCGVSFEATPMSRRLLGLRVKNWDWREGAALMLARELGLRGVVLESAPAGALVECLWQEIAARREGGFLLLLEQELSEHLLDRSSLSAWYHALGQLRVSVLDHLAEDAELCARAETLLHLAVERVSYAAERQQALRRLEFERQGRLLALAGQATSTAFDPEGVGVALRQQLPELGVPSFFVAQYLLTGDDLELPAVSRLLISHDQRRREPVLGSRDFDTRDLVPSGFWPDEPAVGFVVEALHFQNEPLGFALFEIGPRQGAVYMALREQLGAALEGASLVRQVARRALQREQAERARMQEELRIARRVQVSILPTRWQISGLDVAAGLRPGQLAGADYYDIRPDPEGAWLALGSARSGGLGPGLMVPMLQSIVACLCRSPSARDPEKLLQTAMLVLEENVEQRTRERQYFSLLIARYSNDGTVRFAADYAGVALCRWHGGTGRPSVSMLGESPQGESVFGGEFWLAPHDLLLLHTQGLTRSSDFEDAPIHDEQIALELERNRASPVAKIRDDLLNIVQNWSGKRADLSVIVGRRLGQS
jgi:DNA-binding LacI/PurR family transcriptional regulator